MPKKNPYFEPQRNRELNSIWLEGTLLDDGTQTGTEGGQPICRLQVSTSRWHLQDQDLSVFTVEVREPQWQACQGQLSRGRGVRIIGRLYQDRWRDLAGHLHSEVRIVSERIEPRPRFGG
jgi:single-strand DNA-binding protein